MKATKRILDQTPYRDAFCTGSAQLLLLGLGRQSVSLHVCVRASSDLLSLPASVNQIITSSRPQTFLEREFNVLYKLWQHYDTSYMAAFCQSLGGLIKALLSCWRTNFRPKKRKCFKGFESFWSPWWFSSSSKGSGAPRPTYMFAYLDQTDWHLFKPTLHINPEPCTWTQQGPAIITADVLPFPKAKDK